MEELVKQPKIIFLDFLRPSESEILVKLSNPIIESFCQHIENLTIVFSDINDSKEVKNFLNSLDLPEAQMKTLRSFFLDPFQTSFSYGYEEKEFVFIQLEADTPLLNPENNNGFLGLLTHELLHSVQRQRGIEVRLKASLARTLTFFKDLADLIPSEDFSKEIVYKFLTDISQMALYCLKDIYVNVEMMKRGLSDSLLEYYKIELGYGDNNAIISPPSFGDPFIKGKIRTDDLEEFARAFNYTVSLIPIWLPSMVLEVDSRNYSPSRELKHYVFDRYYVNPSLITREMWHLENIFLTSFSFSRGFHLKWFGAIFNLALEYILGEDFVFYHLSKATELIETVFEEKEGEEAKDRLNAAIAPILKAAYLHGKQYPSGIQKHNFDALAAMMKSYHIDEEEIAELDESIMESEDLTHAQFFENLLKVSIMILTQDLREVVFSNQETEKDIARAILALLQAINYLGDECDAKYYHSIRLTLKQLLRSESDFKQKQLAIKLEILGKTAIYSSETEPTVAEVEEMSFNLDFFEVPLSNNTIELGIEFIRGIKIVLTKVPHTNPEFPILAAQFANIQLADAKINEEEEEQINMILVSSLVATKGVPFSKIQRVMSNFLPSDNEEKE